MHIPWFFISVVATGINALVIVLWARGKVRITTTHVFIVCLSVLLVSMLMIWLGVRYGNPDLPPVGALSGAVSGAIVALIINRKMTKGLRRWWDRG